jgi:hypothetical protein
MIPVVHKPGVSLLQKRLALAVAGAADFLQIVMFPAFGWGAFSPVQDTLDAVVAVILMAVCGFRWQWVLAFMMELMPGLDLLPTWTMVVALMPVQSEGAQPYIAYEVEEVGDDGPVRVTRVDQPEQRREQRAQEQVVDVRGVAVPPVRGPVMGGGR